MSSGERARVDEAVSLRSFVGGGVISRRADISTTQPANRIRSCVDLCGRSLLDDPGRGRLLTDTTDRISG